MKRLLSMLLVCVLVFTLAGAACADEAMYQFTKDSFPRMDGSTSMVPLGEAIVSVLLGISREDASGLVHFNRTTQSFRNLASGECDLVIAAEPKSEVFEEMQQNAFPYLMETIAREALVFVVNENNPVDSLTAEQLRGIYSGSITNWKEVGGEDAPIEAFQRNATAGSQVMMEKLVMGDTAMMDAPITHIPGEMAGLIEAVKSYDNSANAIGYTVFYYAADMQMAQGLKILQVDGILPSVETIQAEEYPFINGYYCCISAAADRHSPERKLFQWLISAEGQKLLALEGYVPVSDGEGDPGIVYTDYSGYVPNGMPSAKFTEFPCPQDHLESSDAYGLIYPYDGPELYSSSYDSWDWSAGRLMGFYNHQGQKITNPVYSSISRITFDDWYGDNYFWCFGQDETVGIAAKDGSFVSDMRYSNVYTVGDYILCARNSEDGAYDLYDRDMKLVKTEQDFRMGEGWMVPDDAKNGLFTGSLFVPGSDDYRYVLMDLDGRPLLESGGYIHLENDCILCFDDDWNATVYDRDLNRMHFGEYDTFQSFYALNDLFFYAQALDGRQLVVDRNGSLFDWDFDNYTSYYEDGSFCIYRKDSLTVYNRKGRVLFDHIPREWSYQGDGIFSEETDDGIRLWKMPAEDSLLISDTSWCYPTGNFISCYRWDEDTYKMNLVDHDLHLIASFAGDISVLNDPYTGDGYLIAYGTYGFSGEQRLMSADFQTELLRANGNIGVQNGLFTVSDNWAFRSCTPDGELVFCYPYLGLSTGD